MQHNLLLKNNEIPNFTPTFTSHLTVDAAIPKLYLNDEGLKALKTILWMLNYKFPNINYSPMTTAFCSLLLLYVNEGHCFEMIDNLICVSNDKRELLEKHFIVEAEQFKILVGVTCNMIFTEVEGLESLVHARNIDFPRAVAEMFKVFFISFFKIGFLQRLVSMFFSDGILALSKVAVGTFKVVSDALSEFKRDFLLDLKEYCYTLDDDDSIFAAALRVKLSKTALNDFIIPNLLGLSSYKYIRPNFDFSSRIITNCELESIWSRIPDYLKHCEIKRIYSTTDCGYSLSNLLRICSPIPKQKATILLVRSYSQDVVGGFFEHSVEICSKYIGGYNSFVFTMKPLPCFYNSTGANEMHACLNENEILLGGGNDGIALTIDQELLQASSSSCETYNNPILIAENFEITEIEILSLIST